VSVGQRQSPFAEQLAEKGSRQESRAGVRFERTDLEKLSVFSSVNQPARFRCSHGLGGHPRALQRTLEFRTFPGTGYSAHFRVLTPNPERTAPGTNGRYYAFFLALRADALAFHDHFARSRVAVGRMVSAVPVTVDTLDTGMLGAFGVVLPALDGLDGDWPERARVAALPPEVFGEAAALPSGCAVGPGLGGLRAFPVGLAVAVLALVPAAPVLRPSAAAVAPSLQELAPRERFAAAPALAPLAVLVVAANADGGTAGARARFLGERATGGLAFGLAAGTDAAGDAMSSPNSAAMSSSCSTRPVA
jgi:hypothetical protein